MNLLFLDIDGVCNSLNSCLAKMNTIEKRYDLEEYHLIILTKIVKATHCNIIISSSWRKSRTVEELKELFKDYPIISEAIIGKTPSLTGVLRGDEIRCWLESNDLKDYAENLVGIVILDDDSDMGNLSNYLVKTNNKYGLTYVEAYEVLCKFGILDIANFDRENYIKFLNE